MMTKAMKLNAAATPPASRPTLELVELLSASAVALLPGSARLLLDLAQKRLLLETKQKLRSTLSTTRLLASESNLIRATMLPACRVVPRKAAARLASLTMSAVCRSAINFSGVTSAESSPSNVACDRGEAFSGRGLGATLEDTGAGVAAIMGEVEGDNMKVEDDEGTVTVVVDDVRVVDGAVLVVVLVIDGSVLVSMLVAMLVLSVLVLSVLVSMLVGVLVSVLIVVLVLSVLVGVLVFGLLVGMLVGVLVIGLAVVLVEAMKLMEVLVVVCVAA